MKKKLLIGLATGLFVLGIIIGGANAATVFLDDFEDGDTLGWNTTASGSGSTGVELFNDSQMAAVKHTGNGLHSLSFDFDYIPTDTLSFDMHAVAYPNSASHARSGVTVSFLTSFNAELASASLMNTTNSDWLGTNDTLINNVQHHYNGLMSDYATLAGLDGTDSISKIGLTYFAVAQTTGSWGHLHSNATVWFDNVTVSDSNPVPLPGAIWLLGSGLISLGAFRKKKK